MKKLFFAAVLAIVATSGAALNASALTFYTLGQTTDPIVCEAGTASCADEIDNRVVFDQPGTPGNQGNAVDPSVYADLEFIP